MRNRLTVPALFLLTVSAFAQQPVKVNLLAYFDKVVPPPLGAKEAYDKCDWGQGDQANADKLFKALEDELQRFQIDISTPPGSAQADLMKKMQDPEFQKKMETMSEDEKMKIAMQMSQGMSVTPGPMKPEPQSVIKTLKDCSLINDGTSRDLTHVGEAATEQAKYEQELEAKHKQVDDWKTAEIAKLPVKQMGEDSGPDPKAVYALEISALNKHLAIVDEDLKRTNKLWSDAKTKSKQMFALYEADLESIHFGEDAKNNITKTQLSSGQSLMIGSLGKLAGDSKSAYVNAAGWYRRLVQFQKDNKQ